MCGPPSLVHNIGPLLLQQCTRHKNVLLLLEQSSAFMTEEDVTLAQITAKTIVHMLMETDRVAVVGLGGRGSALCEGLARATDIHKIRLDRHLDSLVRSQTTANESFELDLRGLLGNLSGELVLIHLTNNLKDPTGVRALSKNLGSAELIVHLRTILILSGQQQVPRAATLKEYAENGTLITLPTQHVLGYEIARLFTGTYFFWKTAGLFIVYYTVNFSNSLNLYITT